MLERASGVTHRVEAAQSQTPQGPGGQLGCVGRVEVSHGECEACVQLEGACPTSKHSSSGSFKTLCQPSKIRLQHSVVICPLAQSVVSDSTPTLSKRTCPQHSQLWE